MSRVNDPRVQMAYDAIVKHLASQTEALTNLRNRATGLLGVSALVTSFSSVAGLVNADKAKGAILPTWAGWALLGVLVGIGFLVMAALWPIRDWHYGPSARIIMDRRNINAQEDDIRIHVIDELDAGRRSNKKMLEQRWMFFRLGASLLFGELLILVAALAAR